MKSLKIPNSPCDLLSLIKLSLLLLLPPPKRPRAEWVLEGYNPVVTTDTVNYGKFWLSEHIFVVHIPTSALLHFPSKTIKIMQQKWPHCRATRGSINNSQIQSPDGSRCTCTVIYDKLQMCGLIFTSQTFNTAQKNQLNLASAFLQKLKWNPRPRKQDSC